MAITKLFQQDADLNKINSDALLKGNLNTYYFSLLFTKFSACNLYVLNAQIPGNSWHQLITTPVAENDGEITVRIGTLMPGTVINMIFGIQAISAINSVVVCIVNGNTNSIVKILPKTGNKKMGIGDIWNAPINNFPLQL